MNFLMILDSVSSSSEGGAISDLFGQLQQINWQTLIMSLINVILFIVSTIYTVKGRINTIKSQDENINLKAEKAKLDAEYQKKYSDLQAKYVSDVADLKKALLQRVDDNQKTALDKAKAESVQISGTIQQAQKSLDDLLNPLKAPK